MKSYEQRLKNKLGKRSMNRKQLAVRLSLFWLFSVGINYLLVKNAIGVSVRFLLTMLVYLIALIVVGVKIWKNSD